MASRPLVPLFGSNSSSDQQAGLETREEREQQIREYTQSLSAPPPQSYSRPPKASFEDEEGTSLPLSFGGSKGTQRPGLPQQRSQARDGDDEEDEQQQGEYPSSDDDDEMGPKPTSSSSSSSSSSSIVQQEERAQEEEEEEDPLTVFTRRFKVPVSHSVDFAGLGTKAVACISCEPQGNRVVTGSHDSNAKIFDFGGMDARHAAFRSFVPEAGHPVVSLSHSPTGDKILVSTGGVQPRVFDREGKELIKFVRGDMYIRDMANTKGHTMEVTCTAWHPSDKNLVMTGSLDGTLRLWDLAGTQSLGMLVNKSVLKLRTAPGAPQGRLGATACCYANEGKTIVAGCADGSIHLWAQAVLTRTLAVLRPAHSAQVTWLTSHPTACPGGCLASRGHDGLMLLWSLTDIAKSSSSMQQQSKTISPFMRAEGLLNDHTSANIEFSPDGLLIVAGTAPAPAPRGTDPDDNTNKALLCFFEVKAKDVALAGVEAGATKIGAASATVTTTARPSLCLGVQAGASVVAIRWMRATQQIVCSSSTGLVRIFFDPTMSTKGALLSAGRAPARKKDPSDFAVVGQIITPNALPMYRDDTSQLHLQRGKRVAEERRDPIKQKIPEKAPSGPTKRENSSFFYTQYANSGKKIEREDPREALLKLDALTKSDPMYLGRAYAQTQPVAEMHGTTLEQEAEEVNATKRPRTEK